MKRWLFLAHRWLGIALCLLMALWFLSGVVMMYVGYPKLTDGERLQVLPVLSEACCMISPVQALVTASAQGRVKSLRLSSIGGRAVFVAGLAGTRYMALDAANGKARPGVDVGEALAAVAPFAPGQLLRHEGVVAEDAWTHSKALAGHRPLHRVGDAEGRLFYVSSASGEVVRDVTSIERSWGWVGAWLHWIYPLRGGSVDFLWSDFLIYSALAGSVLVLIGGVLGFWRWRRRPYGNGYRSPYRSAMMRWHHWTGLLGGLLVFTWVVSGLFSMNPWRIFDSGAPALVQPALDAAALGARQPQEVLAGLQGEGFASVELQWQALGNRLYGVASNGHGERRLVEWRQDGQIFRQHPVDHLVEAGRAMLPGVTLRDADLQEEYDWHYFARAEHTMSGHLERPLPVLRLRFEDRAETWLYLDPASGRVVQRLDSHRRAQRILFGFLHSWDWRFFLENRPLWDVLLIVASLIGFLISVSGVVIGWRRLARRRGEAPRAG